MSTPVVFVHGTRSSAKVWAEQVAELERHGVASIAVDLPGHGERSAERFTLTEALVAIDCAVDACAEPPLLVGLSLGGYTSLQYAGAHPEKLAGVMGVACTTPPRRPFVPAYREATRQLNRVFGIGGKTWPVVTDVLREVVACDPIAVLRSTSLPIWLVSGSRDPMRFGAPLYRMANPRAAYSVIRRAGHDANVHQPEVFNAGLLAALAALRERTPLAV